MTLLYVVDEGDFGYLSAQSGFTAGNISSHMSKLEEASYIAVDKAFVDRKPRTVYRLTPKGRGALDTYRDAIDTMFAPLEQRR